MASKIDVLERNRRDRTTALQTTAPDQAPIPLTGTIKEKWLTILNFDPAIITRQYERAVDFNIVWMDDESRTLNQEAMTKVVSYVLNLETLGAWFGNGPVSPNNLFIQGGEESVTDPPVTSCTVAEIIIDDSFLLDRSKKVIVYWFCSVGGVKPVHEMLRSLIAQLMKHMHKHARLSLPQYDLNPSLLTAADLFLIFRHLVLKQLAFTQVICIIDGLDLISSLHVQDVYPTWRSLSQLSQESKTQQKARGGEVMKLLVTAHNRMPFVPEAEVVKAFEIPVVDLWEKVGTWELPVPIRRKRLF